MEDQQTPIQKPDLAKKNTSMSKLDPDHLVKSYFHLALPVVLSSIVTIVYGLVDTYFIAQTNNTLLVAGVSVCAPLFTILMAFGNIFGQGGSSLISRLLGKQDLASVAKVSAFCFYIALIVGALVGGILLILRDPFLTLLGCSADTLPYAREYGMILMIGAPFIVVNFIHMNLLRCEGMSGLSMLGTLTGAVVNIILDPILIPIMGAAGAAIATVIGYIASDLLLLCFVLKKSHHLSVKPCFTLPGSFIKNILAIGFTAAVTNIASSLCAILVNKQLLPYGDAKIAAMGIVHRVIMIVQMILVGFSFGGIPLFGYLAGAGYKKKTQQLLRFCLVFISSLALVMTVFVFLAAKPLIGIITPDADLVQDGIPMLRWLAAGSVFGGIVMLMTCLCQASGKALPAMVLSLSRQGVIFVIVLLLAARLFGYTGLLSAQCAADILSAILAIGIYIHDWGKQNKSSVSAE